MTGRAATAAKVFGGLIALGTLGALLKHHSFAAAVLQGKCPYLAKVVPELKPFVEKAEKGFATLGQCDEFAGLVNRLQHAEDRTFTINGEVVQAETAQAACEKLGFYAAELREAFKSDDGFLLHGYGYTKSDPTERTHITIKGVDRGSIEITTDTSSQTLALQSDLTAKQKLPGTALVMDAVSKFRSDCDDFGELLHESVEMYGGKHQHEETTARGKTEAIETCKKVRAKMDRIETLNFQHLMAALPGVSKDGKETMTVLLERTSQVKFSKRVTTAPIAVDIEHKDGKIHRLTSYLTEARGLVQKYGDRYAGAAQPEETQTFMRRPWDKKGADWEPSPECSKYTAKGRMAVKGCEMCLAKGQPIEECMSCGGKCLKSVCDATDSDGDRRKECFIEMMKDPEKKAAMRECFGKCLDTDEPVKHAVQEFKKESTDFKFNAFVHLDDLELSVQATTSAAEKP